MSQKWGHFPLEKTTRITRDSFESQRDSHVERPEWYGIHFCVAPRTQGDTGGYRNKPSRTDFLTSVSYSSFASRRLSVSYSEGMRKHGDGGQKL